MAETAEAICSDDRRKETYNSAHDHFISLGRCSLLELQAGIERWESYVSRFEKKLKDKLHDEIKLAGLEALVLEELEKHLTNFRGCAPGNRDARGGEVWFKNS